MHRVQSHARSTSDPAHNNLDDSAALLRVPLNYMRATALAEESISTVLPRPSTYSLPSPPSSFQNLHDASLEPLETHNALSYRPLSIERARRSKIAPPSHPVSTQSAPRSSPSPDHHTMNSVSTPAGPSAMLLSILNGPVTDTPATSIPTCHMNESEFSRLSIHDPPVSKPKPIGTTSLIPAGRRRRSAVCAGDPQRRLAGDAASEACTGREVDPALPWPPVLPPSS